LSAGVAVTPDGKHVYVANQGPNTVSVIDTTTNMAAAATIPVGTNPVFVGIMLPPLGVPFLAFKAKLQIALEPKAPSPLSPASP
jgi:YVTN family beta-propeller protein